MMSKRTPKKAAAPAALANQVKRSVAIPVLDPKTAALADQALKRLPHFTNTHNPVYFPSGTKPFGVSIRRC